MTKIISVLNHKGGVGKTTSSASIGAGLANLGKRVLLIDLDPQANLTVNFGLEPEKIQQSIYGALRRKHDLPIFNTGKLDIVVSTLDMSAVEIEIANEPGREYLLKRLINPIKNNYDYIFIDCPPALGLLTLNALSVSNFIIIPMELTRFSIEGMNKLFEVVEKVKEMLNPDLVDFRVLRTKQDQRKKLHSSVAESIQKHYPDNVFETIIQSNVAIEESQMKGLDIFSYDDKSQAAKDYLNVCNELIQIK